MTGVCGDFLLRIEPPTANFFGGAGPFPKKGEPGAETWGGDPAENGGGATWTTGSYDPETDTIYWATGNPYPDGDGKRRPGDDLYTNCILALNPADGKLKWFYQVTPHDVEDWDTTSPLVLVDTVYHGEPRKLADACRQERILLCPRPHGWTCAAC